MSTKTPLATFVEHADQIESPNAKAPPESYVKHTDYSSPPINLDDPHRAALENAPEHAEKPSLQTILAVIVSSNCLS